MQEPFWKNAIHQNKTGTQTEPPLAWRYMPSQLEILAAGFDPISLKQMDDVALLNRVDIKFGMTTAQLTNALSVLRDDYWMLSINGQRLNHYRTLYFDTADFALYHAHVNGRAERYKVRSREYMDTHLSFLEVKRKTRKDRTIKERIRTPQPLVEITPNAESWLESISPLDGDALEPKLWNTFTRITLVSKKRCERVTLDVDLTFYSTEKMARLDGFAVAELKMDMNNCDSPFLLQMRDQRIQRQSFSKYALGVSLLYDQVKKNRMKSKILRIEKILKESLNDV